MKQKHLEELCRGRGIANFYVEGTVCLVDDALEMISEDLNGKIIVMKAPSPEVSILMRKANGIVTQTGGLTCHVAVVAREMGVPAIVGAKDIFNVLHDGMEIGIESKDGEGVVYAVDLI